MNILAGENQTGFHIPLLGANQGLNNAEILLAMFKANIARIRGSDSTLKNFRSIRILYRLTGKTYRALDDYDVFRFGFEVEFL